MRREPRRSDQHRTALAVTATIGGGNGGKKSDTSGKNQVVHSLLARSLSTISSHAIAVKRSFVPVPDRQLDRSIARYRTVRAWSIHPRQHVHPMPWFA